MGSFSTTPELRSVAFDFEAVPASAIPTELEGRLATVEAELGMDGGTAQGVGDD